MFLKQSTAVTVKLGPFLDSTDGNTAETGLTLQKADVRLSVNGGNMAAASADQGASDAGAAHDELGYYDISLDTTDTGTVGRLKVMVHETGALAVWQDFMVLPANVYDSIVGGSDKLQVHADEITAGLITAAAIATDAIDADALATDAVTEIQSGLATASALATTDGKIDTIDNVVDAILLDTAEIGAAGAGLTAINLPDQTMNITGDITGNLSGSVGSVTGDVGGNVTGSVGSLATQAKADVNAECDTAISDFDPPTRTEATSDKDEILAILGTPADTDVSTDIANIATTLAALDANTIATAVLTLADGVETDITLQKALRAILAVSVGRATGLNGPQTTFENPAGTKNRVEAALITSQGVRQQATLDLT